MFLRLHKKNERQNETINDSEIKTKFCEIDLTGFVLPTKIRLSKNNFSE